MVDGARTHDNQNHNLALYQLNYGHHVQTVLKDIRKMVVFAQVVADGSFTAAAKSLNLGKASVSEHVSQLETELKVSLLNRSTRHVTLTEAGQVFLGYCQQIIEQAQAAHDDVSSLSETPKGRLRVSTTVDFSVFKLTPILAEFRQRYPEIKIELVLDDSITDLVAEQIDVAVRIGDPRKTAYRHRSLRRVDVVMVAGKNYVSQNGLPKTLADLILHQWISLTLKVESVTLTGNRNGTEERMKITSAYASNSPMVSYAMVMADLGIAMLPEFIVEDEIQKGNMVRVLGDYEFVKPDICVLYPYSPQVPAKIRVFIDYLLEKINTKE